jgi:hypothetical protein
VIPKTAIGPRPKLVFCESAYFSSPTGSIPFASSSSPSRYHGFGNAGNLTACSVNGIQDSGVPNPFDKVMPKRQLRERKHRKGHRSD